MRDADSIKDNIPFNAELEDRTTEEWCAQVAGLQNEITRLRAALEAVEWVPYEGAPEDEDYAYCPWCNSIRKHGHEKIDPAGCQRPERARHPTVTLVQLLAISAGIAAIVIVLLSNERNAPRPPDAKPDIRLNSWDGQERKIKRS